MINWATVQRELKIHFRSAWTYSFILLFFLFVSVILYVSGNVAGLGQYTKATGTLMNLLVYFLPLMTLISGAFSLTMEKEDGSWSLLWTYPIRPLSWIMGKFVGMFIVFTTILTCAFALGGLILHFTKATISFHTVGWLYLYAMCIVVLFLAIAVCIGAMANNRWQALTWCVGIWVILILAWPVLLMSILHSLPYYSSLLTLQIATLFNPMEFTRIFFTIQMGGGVVFGPQYINWVEWAQHPASVWVFISLLLLWVGLLLSAAIWMTGRSRSRGE